MTGSTPGNERESAIAAYAYTGQANTKPLKTTGDTRRLVGAAVGRWMRYAGRRTSNGR